VIRRVFLFLVGQEQRLALHTHEDLVLGNLEVVLQHGFAILPGRGQRRFIHHVGQVGAGEARRAASQHGKIDIVSQRDLAGVHAQNFFASANVRTIDNNAPVKTSRPQQRWIENVGRLVAAIRITPSFDSKPSISTSNCSKSARAHRVHRRGLHHVTSNRVDFVDEDDARSIFLALLEQIAHAARAHADEHFHEV